MSDENEIRIARVEGEPLTRCILLRHLRLRYAKNAAETHYGGSIVNEIIGKSYKLGKC